MVLHRLVRVSSQAVDKYGRIVGTLTLEGESVNEEQVRRGMAWEYSNYHRNKTYIALQSEAQQARRGLWAQSDPMPPWHWRKLHAAAAPALSATPQPASGQ
jgi:micrococcal nuclease